MPRPRKSQKDTLFGMCCTVIMCQAESFAHFFVLQRQSSAKCWPTLSNMIIMETRRMNANDLCAARTVRVFEKRQYRVAFRFGHAGLIYASYTVAHYMAAQMSARTHIFSIHVKRISANGAIRGGQNNAPCAAASDDFTHDMCSIFFAHLRTRAQSFRFADTHGNYKPMMCVYVHIYVALPCVRWSLKQAPTSPTPFSKSPYSGYKIMRVPTSLLMRFG